MDVRKTFLSALVACFGLTLFVASCAKPSGGGTTCAAGQMECGGSCTAVNTTMNCGTCGNACAAGQMCQSGSCQCAAGLLSCNGACVANDASHCGSCTTTCSGTQVCNNGACSTMCSAGQMQCAAGACANLATDINNCGSCGRACAGGSTCVNSNCSCGAAPQMLCNNTCVNTSNDRQNCGSCGNACATGSNCVSSSCTATSGAGGQGGSGAGGTGPGGSGPGGSGPGGSGAGGTGGSGTGGRGGSTAGTGGSSTGGSAGGATGAGGARNCAIVPPPGATAADVISDFEEGRGVMIPQGTPARDGFWYTYSDGTDGMNQTPTKAPVLMPDTIAAEPTAPCSMNAFHSSATGHPMYVGFGAAFKPARPFTDPPNQMKAAYDVSAYDGITFRAKTGGSPASQPMYIEILAKESQPSTSGGTATVTTIDLYNTRGQIVTVSSTSYTQFFVPFGTLIPRWLPAVGSGMVCPAAGGSVPKCQAAKFVPANALGIQFSFYNDAGFPKPSPAGSYNVFIDDVAFYKRSALPSGMSDLPAFPTGTAMHPFPENATNSRCAKAAGADGKLLATAYKNWKDNFVRQDGSNFKIIRPENGNDTVSEGIAYGMLIAVYMNDKALFDGLYGYWKGHVASNGLMTWCIPSGSGSCSASGGTATDADEDAAFAMMMASKQWSGGSYAADAMTLIRAVLSTDMSGSYIKAGSNYTNTGITNPSYFAPAFYRAFAAFDTGNAAAWNGLANGAYTLLNAISGSSSNGLVPAWCTGGSCSSPASNGAATDTIYQYDSHRTPWRIGMDYCWYGTAAAKTYTDKTSAFFTGKGMNGVGRIYDLYNLNGMEASGAAVNSASIIGTAAAGAMTNSSYSTFMNDGYQLTFDLLNRGVYGYDGVNKSAYSYFNATVGFLMLLTMSGNFNNW